MSESQPDGRHVAEVEPKPLLSNRAYDVFKPIATVVLPGLGALYFALAQIWGFPYAEQVVGTIAAVNVFTGLLLGLSTKSYNKTKYDGSIDIDSHENEDGMTVKAFSLNLNSDPVDLDQKQQVLFKVNGR